MKVVKIVAAATGTLLVLNAAANLTIRKARTSTGAKDVIRDAVLTAVTPAVVTYRGAAA